MRLLYFTKKKPELTKKGVYRGVLAPSSMKEMSASIDLRARGGGWKMMRVEEKEGGRRVEEKEDGSGGGLGLEGGGG